MFLSLVREELQGVCSPGIGVHSMYYVCAQSELVQCVLGWVRFCVLLDKCRMGWSVGFKVGRVQTVEGGWV